MVGISFKNLKNENFHCFHFPMKIFIFIKYFIFLAPITEDTWPPIVPRQTLNSNWQYHFNGTENNHQEFNFWINSISDLIPPPQKKKKINKKILRSHVINFYSTKLPIDLKGHSFTFFQYGGVRLRFVQFSYDVKYAITIGFSYKGLGREVKRRIKIILHCFKFLYHLK